MNIKTTYYIQATDYKSRNIMKASKKLYRALVYRGPLQAQPVNIQSQIEFRNAVFSYIKVQ